MAVAQKACGDSNLGEPVDHASTGSIDDEDWILVSAGCEEADPKPKVVVQTPPLFEFRFDLTLGGTRYTYGRHHHVQQPRSHQLRPTEVPRSEQEKSLLVAWQQQSLLFALPLEVRFQIYNLVLRLPWTNAFGVRMTRTPANPGLPTVLSILGTCRRALYEAEHIFYTSNRLWVNGENFLLSLEPGRRHAVSALAVPADSAAMTLKMLVSLQNLPNLRSLRLERQLPVKYISIRSWLVLASQLAAEAEKLGQLEDFEINTPEATGLTSSEAKGKEHLDRIDERLRRAVRRRTVSLSLGS